MHIVVYTVEPLYYKPCRNLYNKDTTPFCVPV